MNLWYSDRVPRPRDFDLEAALDAAVKVFWTRGYSATSVRELCEAMHIQPGSFYGAFGSKEECFRKSLERYLATQGLPRNPSEDAIIAWLDAIVSPKRTPRGCLLVASAMETAQLDGASQKLVADKLTAMETFFARCLAARGKRQAQADAALLAASVAGIHVLARAGASPRQLRRAADRVLFAIGLAHS